MVIVYRSNTGFTRQYAEMLGKAEKMKAFTIAEAGDRVPAGEEVLYMGPLMAGHIAGIDQAVKKFNLKGVCGVGMSPASQHTMDSITRANYIPEGVPLFYLQGGWAPKKVGWLKRRMVNMVTRSTRETLRAKGSSRSPEEDRYLDFLLHGGSFVAFENLGEIRAWMREQQ